MFKQRNTDNEGEREQVEAQLWLITEDKTREVGLDTKHKKCKTTKVKQEVTDDRVTPREQRDKRRGDKTEGTEEEHKKDKQTFQCKRI